MYRHTRACSGFQVFSPFVLAAGLLVLGGCDSGPGTDPDPGPAPDRTPPQATLTTPLDGSVVAAASISLSGTATDDRQVTHVMVQRNGGAEQALAFTPTGAGVSFSGDVALAPGDNSLVVNVYDAAGNRGSTPARNVLRDPDGPSVSLATPDTVLAAALVRVQGTATDGQRVTRLAFTVNGGAEQPIPVTAGASAPFDVEVPLAAGVNRIRVTAHDAAGTQAFAELTATRDGTPPAAAIHAPVPGATPAREVDVVYSTTDNVGLRSATIRVGGGAQQAVPLSGESEAVFRVPLAMGSNEIELRVQDRAGNTVTVTTRVTRTGPVSFRAVAVGMAHRCALATDGRAYCWGSNYAGQVGMGFRTDAVRVPYAVSGGHTFQALSAGHSATCGLDAQGQVWCWGDNTDGVFGTGNTQHSAVPVLSAGGERFAAIDVGVSHACGLKEDGTAYCWGNNGFGALGNGSPSGFAALNPVPVGGGLRFTEISAGFGNGCGRTSAGAVYCWGWFAGVQQNPTTSPVRVGGTATFRGVVAGEAGGCLLTDTGALCWGRAAQPAASLLSLVPIPVPGRSDFASIAPAPGNDASCGLTASGEGWCWGKNTYGALGNGTRTDSQEPVRVAGGHVFTEMGSGINGSCGLVATGAVYCWGGGGVGDGSYQVRETPMRVADGR